MVEFRLPPLAMKEPSFLPGYTHRIGPDILSEPGQNRQIYQLAGN